MAYLLPIESKMEIFAKAYSKDTGVTVSIGTKACTDGRRIFVPPIPDQADPFLRLTTEMFTYHETGHVLTRDVNAIDKKWPKAMKQVYNWVRDVIVENTMETKYPGMAPKWAEFLSRFIRDKTNDEMTSPTTANFRKVLLAFYIRCRELQLGTKLGLIVPKEIQEIFEAKLEKYVDILLKTRDVKKSLELSERIFTDLKTMPEPPEPPQQQGNKNDQKNKPQKESDSSSGDAGSSEPSEPEDPEEGAEDSSGGSGEPDEPGDEPEREPGSSDHPEEPEKPEDDKPDDAEDPSGGKDSDESGDEPDQEPGSDASSDGESEEDGNDSGDGDSERDPDGEDDGEGGTSDDENDDSGTPDGASDQDGNDGDVKPATDDSGTGDNIPDDQAPLSDEAKKALEKTQEEMDDDDTDAKTIHEDATDELNEWVGQHCPYREAQGLKDDVVKADPKPGWEQEVELYEQNGRIMTGNAGRKMKVLLISERAPAWMRNQKQGRLDARKIHRLSRGNLEVCKRKLEGTYEDSAVYFVCDNSGSMRGVQATIAQSVLTSLSSDLDRLRIPFGAVGFTSPVDSGAQAEKGIRSKPCTLNLMKGFEDPYRRVRHRFVWPDYSDNTAELPAIKFAAYQLASRRETKKVLFILTDGDTATGSNQLNLSMREEMKLFIDRIMRAGIRVVPIGIMSWSLEGYCPDFIYVDNLDTFAREFYGRLTKLLL